MIIKTRPNNKIILYWILTATVLGLLLCFIENKVILYSISGFVFINLLLNKITQVSIRSDQITIAEFNLLFIPSYKYVIHLTDIINTTLIQYKDDSKVYDEFEGSVIAKIISGSLFYKPDFIMVIDLRKNKQLRLELNSDRKSLLKINTFLQKQLRI